MIRHQQKENKDGKEFIDMEDAENPYSSTCYRWCRQRKWNEDKDNQIDN